MNAMRDEDPAAFPPSMAATADKGASRSLTILYGTETGNSSEVARSLARDASRRGLNAAVHDMAEYDPHELRQEHDVLIVVSTTGEGDPPQPAANFFRYVEGEGAARLNGVRYSVLALGDSAYQFFCQAGKRLDRRFEELGAVRLTPRVDCDIDYDEPASGWSRAALEQLADEGSSLDASDFEAAEGAASPQGYDKRNPVLATVSRNISLVGAGSSKGTRHIELAWPGTGLTYEPGDALGIIVDNDSAVVSALLVAMDLSADAMVLLGGSSMCLEEAFARHLEITTATPRFLAYWADLTRADYLLGLQRDDHASERMDFLHAHHVIDIVRKFPARGFDPASVVTALRPLQPRLYSIASSLAVVPDEVHLTVAPVSYALHGEPRRGVATGHLVDRGAPGTALQVYVHPNEHFRLPANDVPIIMIGAGTGVAPYRGFLQERKARGARGRSLLFFGERNVATDFLYQDEWESFRKHGVLTHMEVAFSRDGKEKVYVQHRMRERAAEIYSWLEEGAHLYVCGDAAHLAPDVHEALIQIVAQQRSVGREAADDYVIALQSSHRYHRDVY